MAKIRRGRLTISANIVLTASVITRTLSFGFIIMAIYIKEGDDILDADVIKIADLQDVAGMPLGTTMKSIVFSLNGIFALELLTGILGIWGVIGQRKPMLIIKSCFRDTLFNYIQAYVAGSSYISSTYFYNTVPSFLSKINDNMRVQLSLQQHGYFYYNTQSEITRRWNDMILKLECCGVYSSSDTLSRSNGYANIFCCKHAHESRTDSGWHHYYYYDPRYYYDLLQYFGGCGGYKTDIVGLIFTNKEYTQMRASDILDNRIPEDSHNVLHSKTIIFRTVCNIGTLGLAINVRYDSVFGNSDIEALLSKFRIADHTFTRALNIFSIVVVTFSATSIAVIIFTFFPIASLKWKRMLVLFSVGLWSIITLANIVEIGLWGKFISSADKELEDIISTELINNTYTYQHSQGSGYFNRETSLSWNSLFIKAECCGVGSNITNSFTASYWYMYRRDSTSQRIPVQCCKSQTEVYQYAYQYDSDCTANLVNGYYHSQGCDKVIVNRLDLYSLLFFVLMGINVLAEIGMIATTIYNAVSLTKGENELRVRYRSDEDNVE
ncbi:unnamed protein product [Mytilus coruscus]|uniref:Tetraspanin n=1 Tax=Mytilus coruscus TaxID=42192 RepID=A0A6J8EVL6_MYTCO|nr:unnamed protein product [Mytilus coruscus]